ncbi:MAG: S-methyl-5-thioribose-1-phosphate isomerase, partial [Methanomassiliicoccales archaeon]|nr:S-methyl-5-thioribose-1-phosphate isomerase [Methanomassiliicoccales archaeon]
MRIKVDGESRDMRAVWYEDEKVHMLDQRMLPHIVEVVRFTDHHQVAESIRDMTVRGAPAIGVAAAFGMLLASNNHEDLTSAARELKGTRPTAFDLFFAVDHMLESMNAGVDPTKAAQDYADTIVD